MTDNKTLFAKARRLRAVLALRATSLVAIAKRAGCTPSHARLVFDGSRHPSAALRSKLEAELRSDEWAFVRGEVDVLRDDNAD